MSTALERGLQLLENLAREKSPQSFSNINQELGNISHASLSRLLKRLCDLGYVNKAQESNLYSIGHRMAVFASIKTAGRAEYLAMCYTELMKQISREYDVTVIMLERVKDKLVNIKKIQTEISMHMQDPGNVNVNPQEPWLQLVGAYDNELYERCFSSFQPEFFELIREQGYIYDNQQRRPNVRRLGFPIFDSKGGMIGALGIGGTILELSEEKVNEIIKLVKSRTSPADKH